MNRYMENWIIISLELNSYKLCVYKHIQAAWAAGGEFGILEGRTLALVHPIVMGGLFVYTLWAGYLGWQWRRVRTIQEEINTLKKTETGAKPADEGAPPSPLELQIKELTEVSDDPHPQPFSFVEVSNLVYLSLYYFAILLNSHMCVFNWGNFFEVNTPKFFLMTPNAAKFSNFLLGELCLKQ